MMCYCGCVCTLTRKASASLVRVGSATLAVATGGTTASTYVYYESALPHDDSGGGGVQDDNQADVIAVVRTVLQNSSSHSDGSDISNEKSLTAEKIISTLAILCLLYRW